MRLVIWGKIKQSLFKSYRMIPVTQMALKDKKWLSGVYTGA